MAKRTRPQNPKVTASLALPAGVKLLRTLRGHTRPIGRIAWSPDGRMLASPSQDATVRIWDAETGECMRVIDGHKDKVWDLAYDPSGSMLASASEDRSVKTGNRKLAGCFAL